MVAMAEKEISIEIKSLFSWILLGVLLVALVAELQISFSTPIAFGDEGFYAHLSRWIAENKEYPVWVPFYGTDLIKWGNSKPLFLTLAESGFFLIFGYSDLFLKFLYPFIGFLTAISTYLLAKKLFSEKIGFFAAILIVTVSSIITYSIIFYVEIFSAFMFITGGLLLILHATTKRMRYLILAGVFLGLGLLTKLPNYASGLFFVMALLYEVLESRKITKDIIKRYGIILLIAAIIVLPFFIRTYVNYNVFSCDVTFGQPNICTTTYSYTPIKTSEGRADSGGTSSSLISYGILQYLDFSIGTVWFIPLLFLCGLVLMLAKRSKIEILLILLLLSVIPVFYKTLTSRVEETSRFTIIAVPVIAIICGSYLEKITDFAKRYRRELEIAVIAIVIFIAFLNFGIPGIGQALGYSGKLSSLTGVKEFPASFFETCNWAKQNVAKDARLLSLHTHPTVYNCERAAFWETPDRLDILSGNLSVSLARLKINGYTHIFVQMFSVSSGFLDVSYPSDFVQMLDQNPQNFKKVFNSTNADSLSSCTSKLSQGYYCDGGIIYEINYNGAA